MLLRFSRYSEGTLLDQVLEPGRVAINTTRFTLHVGDGVTLGGLSVGLPEEFIQALIDTQVDALDTSKVPGLADILSNVATPDDLNAVAAILDRYITQEGFEGLIPDLSSRPSKGSVDSLNVAIMAKANDDETTDLLAELVDRDLLFQNGVIRRDSLPAYVDDVREYTSKTGFPTQGTRSIIYVATDTNTIYRWSGTQYIALASPELLTVATTQETLPLVESKKALAPKPLGDVFTMLGFKEVTSGNWELDSGEVDMDIKVVTFFGEVNSSALIGGIDLATLCGLTAGTPLSTNQANDVWLKVGDPADKKIKYISKLPLRYGISWDQLNARGLTTGREVTVKGKKYQVILPSGGSGSPTVVDMTSEWDRLFHAICAGRPSVYKGPVVANYSLSEMGFVTNRWNHCRDLISGTASLSRGNPYSTRGSTPRNNTNGIFTWRPMLVEV